MCHINIFKTTNKNLKNLTSLINVTTSLSFAKNNNGEGFFIPHKKTLIQQKNTQKLIYKNLDYNFLVTHQRYSTSGFNIENTQPLINKRFCVMHNGVIHGIGNTLKSDTSFYLDMLEENFKVYGGDLKKTLNETHYNLSGSFSVVLHDIKTNKTYYFKNSSTNMFILQNKNYMFLSTTKENLILLKRELRIKENIKEVEDGVLFEFVGHNLKKICSLDFVEGYLMPVINTQKTLNYNGYYGGYYDAPRPQHKNSIEIYDYEKYL